MTTQQSTVHLQLMGLLGGAERHGPLTSKGNVIILWRWDSKKGSRVKNKLTTKALLVIGAGLLIVSWVSVEIIDLVNLGRAKRSLTYMAQIATLLNGEAPRDDLSSHPRVRRYLEEQRLDPEISIDGWGNAIEIERIAGRDGVIFRVRSLGSDGKRSSCCAGFVPQDWDTDAVVENGVWQQIWEGF